MDLDRFDSLTRRLATTPSRRRVVKSLGGGLAAGLLALAGRGRAEAAPCKSPKKKCGKGKNAYCADIQTDVNNCGDCGVECGAPANGIAVCQDGVCGIDCGTLYTDCSGECIDTMNDIANCGSCGNVCNWSNGNPICVEGACDIICDIGYANCDLDASNGCETNLTSDTANCGYCLGACPEWWGCIDGQCVEPI